jgi:hypothetical protein
MKTSDVDRYSAGRGYGRGGIRSQAAVSGGSRPPGSGPLGSRKAVCRGSLTWLAERLAMQATPPRSKASTQVAGAPRAAWNYSVVSITARNPAARADRPRKASTCRRVSPGQLALGAIRGGPGRARRRLGGRVRGLTSRTARTAHYCLSQLAEDRSYGPSGA